jgi:hypothetical protein
MKFILACTFILAVSAAAAGQKYSMKYGVTVNAEKGVDFAKFKTYSWTSGTPSPDKAVDAVITAAVDRELAALGMTKAAAGKADVIVTYYSMRRTDVDLNAKPDAAGLHPEQPAGTLLVALVEPSTLRRLLRLRTDKPVDLDPAKRDAIINDAVGELFTKYPTRTKK